MVKKQEHKPPVYTFTIKPDSRPAYSRILVTTSPVSSCFGLSLFPENTKFATVSVTIENKGPKTSLQIANLYVNNGVLYINASEKLRPEFAVNFVEFLNTAGWLGSEVISLDSTSEFEYVGSLGSRLKCLCSKTWACSCENSLDPGNSFQGLCGALLMAAQVYNYPVKCILGVTSGYELSKENVSIFSSLSNDFGLSCNIIQGITRYEQEKYKHQIYS